MPGAAVKLLIVIAQISLQVPHLRFSLLELAVEGGAPTGPTRAGHTHKALPHGHLLQDGITNEDFLLPSLLPRSCPVLSRGRVPGLHVHVEQVQAA